MNISLTPQLEALVKAKVKSGMYHSASEVVRDGLRLLEERENLRKIRLAKLKEQLQIGIDQLDRGEYTTYNEHTLREFIDDVKKEGREKLKQHRKAAK